MFPDVILHGTYRGEHAFIIEYDEHLALAGLPAYYVHRARYKGDKIKNQRKVSELPLPEPRVILGGERNLNGGDFFADVVFCETFEECLTFLTEDIYGLYTPKGSVVGMFEEFKAERKRIEADTRIAHYKEKRLSSAEVEEHHQPQLFD